MLFFSGSFMQKPCSSVDPPTHPVTAQTQLTGGGRAAMTQSRAVQQIPLNPPASRPRVCVFKTQFWRVCEHRFILRVLH